MFLQELIQVAAVLVVEHNADGLILEAGAEQLHHVRIVQLTDVLGFFAELILNGQRCARTQCRDGNQTQSVMEKNMMINDRLINERSCHLRESFRLAQMQLAEHATAQLLDDDQLVARKFFQLYFVVHEERVKVTVRVELMVEWRRGRDAAIAAIQRGRRVGAVAVRVAVIAATLVVVHRVGAHDVTVEIHGAGLAGADLSGRVVLLGAGRRRHLRRLRKNVVQRRR